MPLANWNKIEFIFAHKLYIGPFELRDLEFYTIQFIIKEYEDYIKQENKQYEKQQASANSSMPKFSPGNLPGINVPKINMPSIPNMQI